MKNLTDNKPQLATRVIYLIPLLLIYTIGLSVAHILASESEVPLAHIDKAKLTGHSVRIASVPAKAAKSNTGEEIESFHDILRRVARADAARALTATRQTVFNELQHNVSNSLYALNPEIRSTQQVAESDGKRSLEATRQAVFNELHTNVTNPYYALAQEHADMQKVADNDGARSLTVTRQIVLESLKSNVNNLFHNEFQYLGEPAPDTNLVAEDQQAPSVPFAPEIKLAEKSQ